MMSSQKYLILYLSFLVFLYFLWIVFLIPTREEPKYTNNKVVASPKWVNYASSYRGNYLNDTHTFIHSTYYYKNSKSLGENAIAIVMSLNQRTFVDVSRESFNIVGSNSTHSIITKAPLSIEKKNNRCDYVMSLALTNTVEHLEKLEIESKGVSVQIPFKHAKKVAPKPVVFCIAPQFVAEEWQAFLTQVHVSNRYGAHLHIYLVSIVYSYFDLMKFYEKMGYVTLDYWLTIKFQNTSGPYLEPNRNVEVRNQAAAQTDCLLQYKEAADFVGMIDIDDILFPFQHSSYFEEFEAGFKLRPLINSLYYIKYDYETVKVREFKDQTVKSIIMNAKRLSTTDLGKSFVRPEYYNSTWMHYSFNAEKSPFYEIGSNEPVYRHKKEIKSNGIFHLKRFNYVDVPSSGEVPMAVKSKTIPLTSEEELDKIDEEINELRLIPEYNSIILKLPTDDFYKPMVFNCYNNSFYHLRDIGKLNTTELCVNAFDCELKQKEDLKCIHSDAIYKSGPSMSPITFHFATNHFFTPNIGCYQ